MKRLIPLLACCLLLLGGTTVKRGPGGGTVASGIIGATYCSNETCLESCLAPSSAGETTCVLTAPITVTELVAGPSAAHILTLDCQSHQNTITHAAATSGATVRYDPTAASTTLEIHNCLIEGGTGTSEIGVRLDDDTNSGTLTLRNTIIGAFVASSSGFLGSGDVGIQLDDGTLNVYDSTVYADTPIEWTDCGTSTGSGCGAMTLRNSTFAGSGSTDGYCIEGWDTDQSNIASSSIGNTWRRCAGFELRTEGSWVQLGDLGQNLGNASVTDPDGIWIGWVDQWFIDMQVVGSLADLWAAVPFIMISACDGAGNCPGLASNRDDISILRFHLRDSDACSASRITNDADIIDWDDNTESNTVLPEVINLDILISNESVADGNDCTRTLPIGSTMSADLTTAGSDGRIDTNGVIRQSRQINYVNNGVISADYTVGNNFESQIYDSSIFGYEGGCTGPTVQTEIGASSLPLYTNRCNTATDDGFLAGHVTLPDGYVDGTDIAFEFQVLLNDAGTPTETLHGVLQAGCSGDTDTMVTLSTNTNLDVAWAGEAQWETKHVSATVTADGSCVAGDDLYWQWKICDEDADAASTGCSQSDSTASLDTDILSLKIEYQTFPED